MFKQYYWFAAFSNSLTQTFRYRFCSHSNLIISSFSPNLLLFTNSTTIHILWPKPQNCESYIWSPRPRFLLLTPPEQFYLCCFTWAITAVSSASCSILFQSIFYIIFGVIVPKCIYYCVTHLLKIFQWLWAVFILNFLFSRAYKHFHISAQ